MPFEFEPSKVVEGVMGIQPKVFGDERGHFLETFKRSEFEANGILVDWTQDNVSVSEAGILRGMHYQLSPYAQGKLVRASKGSLLDVMVDMRKGSPTYGKWDKYWITSRDRNMVWVPPGFAHAVLVLEDGTELHYKVSGAEWTPDAERGIRWDDPDLAIDWPSDVTPTLNDRDAGFPTLVDAENNFNYEDFVK